MAQRLEHTCVEGVRGSHGVTGKLAIVSFAGWLTLQPLSVYQGWLTVDSSAVAAVGIVAGLVIGGWAAILGWSQAIKPPPPAG
jgi:hypothetical protein